MKVWRGAVAVAVAVAVAACAGFAHAAPPQADPKDALYSRLPPPLTLDTFDEALAEGNNLVEFFSPYCHHCNALLPTWVQFYEQGVEGLTIHQVNCVTNGDLCDREAIKYYPVVRFYGPGSKLLGSYNTSPKTLDGLGEFAHEQLADWGEVSVTEPDSKAGDPVSDPLTGSDLAKLLLGPTVPTLVSFWPASDSELNAASFNGPHTAAPFHNYPLAYTFRNMWNLALRGLADLTDAESTGLATGYVNCKSNAELCSAYDLDSLVLSRDSEDVTPVVMLFVPNTEGGQGPLAIRYTAAMDLEFSSLGALAKRLTHWTRRMASSANLEPRAFNQIVSFVNAKTSLEAPERVGNVEDFSKVGFVIVGDPASEVQKDDAVFRLLLQDLADLPIDAYLFKTHDVANVQAFLETQQRALADYINLVAKEGVPPAEFDKDLFVARSQSTYPTLLCIKGGSLVSHVYQSFQSEDMRSHEKLLSFMRANALPIVDRLTAATVPLHFPTFDGEVHDRSQNVLLHLTDFTPSHLFHAQFYLSWVLHAFHSANEQTQFGKTLMARQKKRAKVDALKAAGADSVDVVMELKHPIPSAFNKPDNALEAVYLDVAELGPLASHMGWNIDPRKYAAGDSILVSKFRNAYWDHSKGGEKGVRLNQNAPFDTLQLIERVCFEGLSGSSLRTRFWLYMVAFYLALAGGLYLAFKAYKRWSVRDHKGHLGLLGLDPAEARFSAKAD